MKTRREKYKWYWYGSVMTAIRNYENAGLSPREQEVNAAIDEAIEETLKMDEGKNIDDGKVTVQIVHMTLIKHTHTLEGAAMAIPGLSHRKARRLRSDFIYRVAKKIGYRP